jgi:hypothetical protein
MIPFAGYNKCSFLTLGTSGIQKAGERVQCLFTGQAVKIELVTDRYYAPFDLPQTVTSQWLQHILVGSGIVESGIKFQAYDFLSKKATGGVINGWPDDNRHSLYRFSG